jgi:hypothetical protein
MIEVHPDLPEWSFEVQEVSAGVYEVIASDKRGRRFSSKGTDPDELLESCREQAMCLVRASRDVP